MKRLLLAITFLTRLPLPTPKNVTAQDMGRTTPFFTLVGLFIGFMLVGVDRLFSFFLPPFAVNAILFVSLVAITGGLHLDGLMDACDGVFSGRDRSRSLEIMRDSRVGAFGVLGAICLVVLKIAFLNALRGDIRWSALLLFPMLGRWGMVWAITLFPYARSTPGLGKSFTEHAKKRYIVLASLPVFAIAITLFLWQSIPILVITCLAIWLSGKWLSRKLGGLTGDTYGAICEITETLSLMIMCANQGRLYFFS